MSSVNYVIMADIYDCADEVSAYLQDFTNWGTPVIPPVEDCPPVIFDPQYFSENDQKWVCPSTYNSMYQTVLNLRWPNYLLNVLMLLKKIEVIQTKPNKTLIGLLS